MGHLVLQLNRLDGVVVVNHLARVDVVNLQEALLEGHDQVFARRINPRELNLGRFLLFALVTQL